MKRCILIADEEIDLRRLSLRVAPDDMMLPLTIEGRVKFSKYFKNLLAFSQAVPYARICELATKSAELLVRFASCDKWSGSDLDGIDWRSIFIEQKMGFYFRDLLLVNDLKAFLADNFDEIVWIGNERYPHLDPYNAFFEVIHSHFADSLVVWSDISTVDDLTWLRILQGKFRTGLRRLNHLLHGSSMPKLPLWTVAIFSTTQWERFTEALIDLQENYGPQFQIWYLGIAGQKLRTWANENHISVTGIPYPLSVDEDVREFFRRQWDYWIAHGRYDLADVIDCPIIKEDSVTAFLKQYFFYTLPHTAQWARTLRKYLKFATPKWVIGSTAETYMTKFPYYVCNQMGIPSIAMSHAYVSVPFGRQPSTYLACHNQLERENHRNSFADDNRILLCRNSSNRFTYDVDATFIPARISRQTIAIFSASPAGEDSIMPYLDDALFVATLDELSKPAEEFADFDFVFKFHPRSGIISLLNDTRPPYVLEWPQQGPAIDLLGKAWVIVICNHYGSIVAESIVTGKPIVFLDTAHFFCPDTNPYAYKAGEVVRDMASFWNILRQLRSSESYYSELSERCRQFRDEYLSVSNCTLVQAMKEIETQYDHKNVNAHNTS